MTLKDSTLFLYVLYPTELRPLSQTVGLEPTTTSLTGLDFMLLVCFLLKSAALSRILAASVPAGFSITSRTQAFVWGSTGRERSQFAFYSPPAGL